MVVEARRNVVMTGLAEDIEGHSAEQRSHPTLFEAHLTLFEATTLSSFTWTLANTPTQTNMVEWSIAMATT